MKKIIAITFSCLILAVWTTSSLFAQDFRADDIIGTWLNEEVTGQVEIFKSGTSYYGKIVWLKEPIDINTGKPRTDIENPESSRHNDPLIGLVNLKGFAFDGDDEWEDGTIYDPKNGKTYSCYMKFEDASKKRLKIRGYIGVSLLGRTTLWTPVKK